MTSKRTLAALLYLVSSVPQSASAATPPVTNWQQSQKSMSRLLVGSLPLPGSPPRLIVGLEIHIERGWKTYWRHPGDAGGIPPRFDWSKSQNLKSANVLYPAPQRLSDASGSLIGYTEHVVFPVEIEAMDDSRPVRLALHVEYGVCSEICILAEARHTLTVRTTKPFALPPPLHRALEAVPRPEAALRTADPRLLAVALAGTKPARLLLDVAYPAAPPKEPDIFVETLSGTQLPMARRLDTGKTDRARFEVTLPADLPPRALKGHPLRITATSATGSSQWTRTLD